MICWSFSHIFTTLHRFSSRKKRCSIIDTTESDSVVSGSAESMTPQSNRESFFLQFKEENSGNFWHGLFIKLICTHDSFLCRGPSFWRYLSQIKKIILTTRCHWSCWAKLRSVIDTTESDSLVSLTQLILSSLMPWPLVAFNQ